MNKVKTRKSFSKRFRVTAGGKVKYKKQGLRHILTKKSSKRKRMLRRGAVLSSVESRRVLKALGQNNVRLNRKSLAYLAAHDTQGLEFILQSVNLK